MDYSVYSKRTKPFRKKRYKNFKILSIQKVLKNGNFNNEKQFNSTIES